MSDITLLSSSELEKKLVKYYLLFSEQQNSRKQKKSAKKPTIITGIETSVTQKKPREGQIEESYKVFRIDANNTMAGIIYFRQDSKNYTLTFSIINKKNNTTYTEIIYLPIIIDINDTLLKIKSLQNRYYSNIDKESIDEYNELALLEQQLESIKSSQISNLRNIYSNQLQNETDTILQIRNKFQSLSRLESGPARVNAIRDYLKINQQLDHTIDNLGNQIILPGAISKVGNDFGIIDDINKESGKYIVNINDMFVEKDISDVMIQPSIRNRLLKIKTDDKSIVTFKDIVSKITNVDLFLDVLDISEELVVDDLINRPRLEKKTEFGKEAIAFIEREPVKYVDEGFIVPHINISQLFNDSDVIVIGGGMPDSRPGDFSLDNISHEIDISLENWRKKFSVIDMSTPFLIDDFEFSSISHYHKASQFYNRLDLSIDKKLQYNDLFIRLSRDYRGLGGLGNIEPKFLVEILDNIALKKPFNWNLTFNGYRSLSSVYLSKAYYTKFNNNPELKAALISTYPAKIIERVGKYTFKTNYELMLARYYIVNGETPEFAKFNYNSLIRSDFNMKNKDKTIREHELLLRVFLENKAFENKLAFVDNTILLDDYIKLDVKGATKPNIIENYIHELLFKYNSVYIHSKLTSYIYDTKQSVINLDRFLKSNPDIDIKYHWIVSFYFEYILTSLRLEKQRLVDEAARLEESAKLLEQSEMASIKNKYEILRRLLKGNGYLLVDIPAIKDNIYHAVMDSLIRVDIFPFNFKNSLDTRNKANSKKFLVKNQIFDDKEYVVYENAVELLGNLLAKLFELNKPGQELELSIEDLLTLVSRLFGIDIKVISENEFVEIDFNKSLEMYPKMIDGYKNHTIAQTGFVLGHIDDTDYYFSSRPDVSQNTELLEYLYEPKSGVLIQEINDEHRIIGVWDPINIILDTTRHVDISMLLDGDIDVDIFQLYKIGERIYYKERELYIS